MSDSSDDLLPVRPPATDEQLAELRTWLLVVARSRCGDRHLLEDAVQDCLGNLWERWGEVRDPSKLRGYALVAVLNRLRTLFSRSLTITPVLPEDCRIAESDPAAQLELEEDLAWLRRQLRSLPSPYRDVLSMRRQEGLGTEHVAEPLGVTPERVRRLVHEGERRLKERARQRRRGEEVS